MSAPTPFAAAPPHHSHAWQHLPTLPEALASLMPTGQPQMVGSIQCRGAIRTCRVVAAA